MLTHLCRIAQDFEKLGGSRIGITIMDHDTVSEANLGRQCFCEADIGQPKAIVLAQRARAFFGLDVDPEVCKLSAPHLDHSIVVGCVDNLAARRVMSLAATDSRSKDGSSHRYWLDIGNTADSGQVILGGHGLPTVFDVLPQMKTMKETPNLPSCSLAEALAKQDLFINSTLANLGAHLLWQLIRRGGLNHHGYFVNLTSGNVRPIHV